MSEKRAPYGPLAKNKWLVKLAATGVGGSEMRVAAVLQDKIDSVTGTGYPSFRHFSKHTNLCERSCKRAMRKLIDIGFVELVERGNSKSKANLYRLLKCRTSDAQDTSELVTPQAGTSDKNSQQLVTPDAPQSIHSSKPYNHELEKSFETFWRVYDKPGDKRKAKASWFELSPDAELAAYIRKQASRYKDSRRDPQFRKLAYKWLADKEWEDAWLTEHEQQLKQLGIRSF